MSAAVGGYECRCIYKPAALFTRRRPILAPSLPLPAATYSRSLVDIRARIIIIRARSICIFILRNIYKHILCARIITIRSRIYLYSRVYNYMSAYILPRVLYKVAPGAAFMYFDP